MKVGGWETVARGEEKGEGQAGGVLEEMSVNFLGAPAPFLPH